MTWKTQVAIGTITAVKLPLDSRLKAFSVEKGSQHRKNDSVYATRVRAGKRRTYFFDVKQTKGNDYYITLTESTRRSNGEGYERHKLFLYKEDFNRFLASLEETIDYIKTELLPDYDYGEFDRRHAENDARLEESTDDNPPSDYSQGRISLG